MGISRFTLYGPYVECKVQKTTETFHERVCPNVSNKLHPAANLGEDGKFCSECGNAIVEISVEEEVDAVNAWELQEDFDGAMWQPFGDYAEKLGEQGLHIWVGGKRGEDGDDEDTEAFADADEEQDTEAFVGPEDEEFVTEVCPADIETELKEFSQDYVEELDRLRAAYGVGNVTIKWGIIQAINY